MRALGDPCAPDEITGRLLEGMTEEGVGDIEI